MSTDGRKLWKTHTKLLTFLIQSGDSGEGRQNECFPQTSVLFSLLQTACYAYLTFKKKPSNDHTHVCRSGAQVCKSGWRCCMGNREKCGHPGTLGMRRQVLQEWQAGAYCV